VSLIYLSKINLKPITNGVGSWNGQAPRSRWWTFQNLHRKGRNAGEMKIPTPETRPHSVRNSFLSYMLSFVKLFVD